MAERVKEDLIHVHHADLVVGPDSYLDLPNLVGAVEHGEKAINVELSTQETYKGCYSFEVTGRTLSPVSCLLCAVVIIFVRIASYLIQEDASVAGTSRVS